ncbi:MAG TPA: GNAT family N-acetyltransferase [Rhodanobacteraceae bacterium]|nr:GNAT family N-acetyltransferase [Rhodanobacteraceae bacterium]
MILHTPRLLLRPLTAADAPALTAYRRLPEVARYQSWSTFDEDDAAALIAAQAAAVPDAPGRWLQRALVESASGALVGDCGIHFLADDPRQVELGITLAPSHQGKGLAAEALTAVLAHLFGTLQSTA